MDTDHVLEGELGAAKRKMQRQADAFTKLHCAHNKTLAKLSTASRERDELLMLLAALGTPALDVWLFGKRRPTTFQKHQAEIRGRQKMQVAGRC